MITELQQLELESFKDLLTDKETLINDKLSSQSNETKPAANNNTIIIISLILIVGIVIFFMLKNMQNND